MAKIIHTMIRVFNEKKSVQFYHDVTGLVVADRFDFNGFTLIYLKDENHEIELELTINHDRLKPYEHGESYGYISFLINDLDAEHRRLQDKGYKPLPVKELFFGGKMIERFFVIVDPDGYRIKLVQRYGRFSG